jgi:hypothetical protein
MTTAASPPARYPGACWLSRRCYRFQPARCRAVRPSYPPGEDATDRSSGLRYPADPAFQRSRDGRAWSWPSAPLTSRSSSPAPITSRSRATRAASPTIGSPSIRRHCAWSTRGRVDHAPRLASGADQQFTANARACNDRLGRVEQIVLFAKPGRNEPRRLDVPHRAVCGRCRSVVLIASAIRSRPCRGRHPRIGCALRPGSLNRPPLAVQPGCS